MQDIDEIRALSTKPGGKIRYLLFCGNFLMYPHSPIFYAENTGYLMEEFFKKMRLFDWLKGGPDTTKCGLCGKMIPKEEMQESKMANLMPPMPGVDWKKMPNVMENLAMKCNRCGEWICCDCASKTAMGAGAGMIKHSDCGGMFKTL